MNKILQLLVFLSFSYGISAQGIAGLIDFDVQGYDIKKTGYPSNIVPLVKKGHFAYAEYWLKGKSGRFYSAYYLQGLSPKGEELWAKPIYDKDKPVIKPLKLYRIGPNILVVGKYLDKKLRNTRVYKMFSVSGTPVGLTKSLNSNLLKISDKHTQDQRLNQTKNHLIWWAYLKGAEKKSFDIAATVVNAQGRVLWTRKLSLPVNGKNYFLQEVNADNKGNAIFIFNKKNPEDTLNKPLVFFYDYRQKNFISDTLTRENKDFYHLRSFVLPNYILITGILSGKGIVNNETEQWESFFLKKYDALKRYTPEKMKTATLSDSLLKTYKEQSAYFNDFEIVYEEEENLLYWIAEEHQTKLKPQGQIHIRKNIAVACWDMSSDTLRWMTLIKKNQRDFSDKLLSYFAAPSELFLNFLFLTEAGAKGKLRMVSLNKETGGEVFKDLTDNMNSDFYIFPKRSAKISDKVLAVLGRGDLKRNGYRILLVVLK